MSPRSLVLASASPRRKEILLTLGVACDVWPSRADEDRIGDEAPRAYVRRVARAKAEEVAEASGEGRWVLGADTIVVVDGAILGKPETDAANRGMLGMLAGRWHEVTTAVVLARAGAGEVDSVTVTTRVRFRALTPAMVERYVDTGEGRDKAGGYAVQGLASGFVQTLEGSYSNVVGLPAAETVELLERHGVISGWPS